MPSLKDIRKRIASVKNTQKITRAMKLVAAAKLRRAEDAMRRLRPYATKHRELLQSLVRQLGADAGEAPHPLLERRAEVKRIGVLAISSDRGMCGAFNSSVQRALARFVKERGPEAEAVRIYPLGRRVALFVRKRGLDVAESFGDVTTAGESKRIREITSTLVDAFLGGELDEVVIISNKFKSAIAQVPTVETLLPVTAEADASEGGEVADLIYEPDQATLLSYVVPRYVEVQVRQAILESIAGEHAARMNAMNSATDNASEMIAALTLQMNRARQAAITKELMEIIGGAEALK